MTSVSTFPPEDIFTKDAESIAKSLASKKVSPKGIGSGIRMVQYFINRGGKNLPVKRKQELERAKKLLQEKLRAEKANEKWPGGRCIGRRRPKAAFAHPLRLAGG